MGVAFSFVGLLPYRLVNGKEIAEVDQLLFPNRLRYGLSTVPVRTGRIELAVQTHSNSLLASGAKGTSKDLSPQELCSAGVAVAHTRL